MHYIFQKIIQINWSIHLNTKHRFSILIINLPTIVILYLYFNAHKEVAQQWALPSFPKWSLHIVVILIAAINGLREELLYRGLFQSLSSATYSPWFIILFQAISFGTLHFMNAFPQGWLGVGLTALWVSALAIQYHFFRSISLAWLTHSIADAIMFRLY